MDTDVEYGWRYDAKCKDMDTEIFYPPRDKALYTPIADMAKSVCWGTGEGDPECPVRGECLWDAVVSDDSHGIWGGLSHRERSHLVRKYVKTHGYAGLKDYILEWDGGSKAKRHAKDVS